MAMLTTTYQVTVPPMETVDDLLRRYPLISREGFTVHVRYISTREVPRRAEVTISWSTTEELKTGGLSCG